MYNNKLWDTYTYYYYILYFSIFFFLFHHTKFSPSRRMPVQLYELNGARNFPDGFSMRCVSISRTSRSRDWAAEALTSAPGTLSEWRFYFFSSPSWGRAHTCYTSKLSRGIFHLFECRRVHDGDNKVKLITQVRWWSAHHTLYSQHSTRIKLIYNISIGLRLWENRKRFLRWSLVCHIPTLWYSLSFLVVFMKAPQILSKCLKQLWVTCLSFLCIDCYNM